MSTKWKRLTGELNDISCPQSENFSWRTLLYFMSTKLKSLTGELYDISWKYLTGELYCISYPQSGKFWLENSTVFHVHEVEKIHWRDVQYFMSTKWKTLAGELYDISCPRSGKV